MKERTKYTLDLIGIIVFLVMLAYLWCIIPQ